MWFRIVDIDLNASCVHLEVAPDQSEECFARLDAFVSRCADEGIDDVRLYHRRGTSKRNKSRLEDFAAMKRLRPPALSRPRRRGGTGASGGFRSESLRRRRPGSDGPRVRYQLDVGDLVRAVDRLHTMTALVCACEDLDPRSTLLLRLCVYELASNSVEHGTFSNGSPGIRLELLFSHRRAFVKYRDNADVFLTTGPVYVDLVRERINTKTKRGLGLYMLNKLCSDFKYTRTDDWNMTSFNLELKRNGETVTKR